MRLYFVNATSPYRPATWKGAWNTAPSSSVFDKTLDPIKWALNGSTTRSQTFNTGGVTPYTVGILRLVSRKLAAQTIDGTVDICALVNEGAASANAFYRLHLYVTQGDSDLVRGVLLTFDDSASGTEFPTTGTGKAFSGPQALTPVVVQEGDRLVAELGVSAIGAAAGSNSASYRAGVWGFTGAPYADMVVGDTSSARAGYLDFSDTITLSATENTNVSPEYATDLPTLPAVDAPTPTYGTQEYWYKHTAAANGGLWAFAGRSAVGTYAPTLQVWLGPVDASFDQMLAGVYAVADTPYLIPATTGQTIYLQALDYAEPDPVTGSLALDVQGFFSLPADLDGYLLIPPDSAGGYPAIVLDPTTGAVVGVVPDFPAGETGASDPDTATLLVADKNDPTALHLYDVATLSLTLTINPLEATGSDDQPIALADGSYYVLQFVPADGVDRLTQISTAGVVGSTWDLTVPGGSVNATAAQALAVRDDGRLAYYARGELNDPIRVWDLQTNSALADLTAGQATFKPMDLLALRDGSILVLYRGATSADPNKIERYDSSGVLQTTYDPQAISGLSAYFIDHIRQAPDDPDSFWVWMQNANITPRAYAFVRYTTETGAVAIMLEQDEYTDGILGGTVAASDSPSQIGGAPNSCPLLVLRTGTSGGGGGGGGTICLGLRGAPRTGI